MSATWADDVPRGEHERRGDGSFVAFVLDQGSCFRWSLHRLDGTEGATRFMRSGEAETRDEARARVDRVIDTERKFDASVPPSFSCARSSSARRAVSAALPAPERTRLDILADQARAAAAGDERRDDLFFLVLWSALGIAVALVTAVVGWRFLTEVGWM